ncbi:hypothetical protein Ari01nite_40010 [Paractinoplanes rishiriensis]|uniref:Uncharacterized protein n=1 Tax=Paractinoplanes rishiriensis TaxID=1050105 RepID=A0A919K4N9_9ACTN|nr:hypothetical protein Ari01nite_40010 [Actinoplanes rishiriensis]
MRRAIDAPIVDLGEFSTRHDYPDTTTDRRNGPPSSTTLKNSVPGKTATPQDRLQGAAAVGAAAGRRPARLRAGVTANLQDLGAIGSTLLATPTKVMGIGPRSTKPTGAAPLRELGI